jgi:hypothetical protein
MILNLLIVYKLHTYIGQDYIGGPRPMVNTAHTQGNIKKNSTGEGLATLADIILRSRGTRGPG